MGVRWSNSKELYFHPEDTPKYNHEPKFDPLYGFPEGRKERVMVAKPEELESMKMPQHLRNYCSHLRIDYMACKRNTVPFNKYMCSHEYHAWANCEYEDWIIRMKDYEREKRLVQRKRRIDEANKAAEGA